MRKIAAFILTVSLGHSIAESTVSSREGHIPPHLRPYLEQIRKEYKQGYWSNRMEARALARLSRAQGVFKNGEMLVTDTMNVPLLLGIYSGSTNIIATSAFQQMLFDGPNPTGTMTAFYLENSYGHMYMTGKVNGWFTVARDFNYYVHDGGTRNAGLVYGGRDFTIDILVVADKSVDFSQFVKYTDAEGAHVPQLGVVHCGADAASGADNIWSHRWNIRDRLLQRKNSGIETIVDVSRILPNGHYVTNDSLNGKPVIFDGDYALEPELLGNRNTQGSIKPIGVFTHEFGHIFGLPDLYDTDNSSEGLGNWCLMASGSYGGDGNHEATPAHMSAWCKERLGWVTPIVVSTFLLHKSVAQVETSPEIYKIYIRGVTGGQYFLIESRQQAGFDKYLSGAGLLIFHVDPAVTTGNTNENHPLVDLEQADGNRDLNLNRNRGDGGDPFPGLSNNRTFDGFSKPDSRDYALTQSYVGVRKISNPGSVMYADLDVGTRPYVVINSMTVSENTPSNGNGRVEAGEGGTVTVSLSNIYPRKLVNGKAVLTTPSTDILIDTTTRFVAVDSLGSVNYAMNGVLSVKAGTVPKTIPLTVQILTQEDTFARTFEAVVGYPKVLIVGMDSSSIENNEVYYQDAVAKYGSYFEKQRIPLPSIQELQFGKRDIVIYYTGRRSSGTVPDSVGNGLKGFLDNGGKLFVTGQNIAEDLAARSSPLPNDLFHAQWVKNVIFGKIAYGYPGDTFGRELPKMLLAGGNGASNQQSPDVIGPDSTVAHRSLYWNGDTSSCAGVWWENPAKGTKVVFWSFGFEAINDSTSDGVTRNQAMTAVLNWFNGLTSVPELAGSAVVPSQFSLLQNYPNPFNPVTKISYGLKERSRVSLKIFDALGREVKEIVNALQDAGWYSVSFDASGLASGTYFCRLQAENYVEVKKLSLLK